MQQHKITATTPTTMATRMVVMRRPFRAAPPVFMTRHLSFSAWSLRRRVVGDSPQYFLKQ